MVIDIVQAAEPDFRACLGEDIHVQVDSLPFGCEVEAAGLPVDCGWLWISEWSGVDYWVLVLRLLTASGYGPVEDLCVARGQPYVVEPRHESEV